MMDHEAGAGWRRYLDAMTEIDLREAQRQMEERRRAAVRLADAVGELVEAALAEGMDAEAVREVLEGVGRRVG